MNIDFSVRFPAPAKVNRFLHITGRRADGYHALQTVFQFVDLCDWLRFSPLAPGQFELHAQAGPGGDDNLCLRAARLLQEQTRKAFGVRVELTKNIPVGGGLGGGSSDAATTLVALNHLFELNLAQPDLMRLGLRLGADVPVFVQGHAAWAEGVGERLTPVTPDTPWALLIDPGVSVSTATMFAAGELTRDCPPETISNQGYGSLANVFEPLVRARYPVIDEALGWLEDLGIPARLSGTGGCLFGLFAEEDLALQAHRKQPQPWRSWIVRLRNRSPLCDWQKAPEIGGTS